MLLEQRGRCLFVKEPVNCLLPLFHADFPIVCRHPAQYLVGQRGECAAAARHIVLVVVYRALGEIFVVAQQVKGISAKWGSKNTFLDTLAITIISDLAMVNYIGVIFILLSFNTFIYCTNNKTGHLFSDGRKFI